MLCSRRRSVYPQQGSQAFADLAQHQARRSSRVADRPLLPRDAPGLICQHGAMEDCALRQRSLEGIVTDTARDRANDAKPGCCIVAVRRQDDRRASPALFVADRRIKIDPDEVAGLRTILTRLRCQRAPPSQSHRDGCPGLCRPRVHRACNDACAATAA